MISESPDLTGLHPLIVSEDVSKRGSNEKHFLCDDGRGGVSPA